MRFAKWLQESSDDLTQIHMSNSGNGNEVRLGTRSSPNLPKTNTPMDSFRMFYHHNWGDWSEVMRSSKHDPNIANLVKQIEQEMSQKNTVDKAAAARAASLHQLVSAIIKTHGRGTAADRFDSDLFGGEGTPTDDSNGSWVGYNNNGNNNVTLQSPDPGSTTKLAPDKTMSAVWEKFREYEKRLTDIESRLSKIGSLGQ